MSAAEGLGQIQHNANMVQILVNSATRPAAEQVVIEATPDLVAALRATLYHHAPRTVGRGDARRRVCGTCCGTSFARETFPCPTRRSIESALGGTE